jgi:hypothetical protein
LPATSSVPGSIIGERLPLHVKLVADLADHFFDQVFQGHNTGHTAKLVDDDGHVQPLALEGCEQFFDRQLLGHGRGRAEQRANVQLPVGAQLLVSRSLRCRIPRTWSKVAFIYGEAAVAALAHVAAADRRRAYPQESPAPCAAAS